MIFINFKLYQETSNENTLKLCQLINKVNQENPQVSIIPCLSATSIFEVKSKIPSLEIWAQHADPVEYGKFTGYLSPFSLKYAGASGLLLNHPEHKMNAQDLALTTKICKQNSLKVFIDTDSIESLSQATTLNPDYLSLEDTQVISGPVPMIEAQLDTVKQAIELSQQSFIVGGGIRTADHVKKSLKVGAAGVLLASEFALSKNHQETLRDLVSGFNEKLIS